VSVPLVRFRIWWLMVVTAIVAVLLAWLDVAVAVALMGMVIIAVVPVTCSSPKRRLIVTSWTLALYPVMIPVYLYLAWLTAWCVLGHRPRPYLDAPETLGPIVHVPAAMFFLSIQAWSIVWKISACAYGILIIDWLRRQSNGFPLLIPPCAWLVAFVTLMNDSMRVLYWYMD
jgi:hypothetical protein